MNYVVLILLASLSLLSFADNHNESAANKLFAVETQLCSLNDGKTMKQYRAVMDRYYRFADKHQFDIVGVRQTPLFTNSGPSNPATHDFNERWASTFKESGSNWELLINDPEGQKIMSDWTEVATCYGKMSSGYALYVDAEAMNKDDNRIVTWNWCTRKDDISWDNINQQHRNIAAEIEGKVPNIAWLLYFPQIGSSDAPGEFAHAFVYPDMNAFMAEREWFNNQEGWRIQDDYYNTYADCRGDSAMFEEVIYRPKGN